MKLLITGGCGFIGSNFINKYFYKNEQVEIINIDAMYYCAKITNIRNEIRESNRYHFIQGNLCNGELVRYILHNFGIEYVIHFAAQSHVQNSFEDSILFTRDNVFGTHTLLEECRKYNKIKKFIHVSTDEVYGETKNDDALRNEESIFCPTNPYAASKAGAELIANSYYYSYKLPIIITRGNNVFGHNQYPEKLIPRFIELLKNNQKVTIQGDGSNIRDFLFVEDVVDAFILIFEKGNIGEVYNIGCDENMEYTVYEIAKILIEKIKKTTDYEKWIEYIEDRPYNDFRYHISNQKLRDLGWSIKYTFDEGIDILLDSYESEHSDPNEILMNN
jgi:dTDP-glucose 4,6-dehydratase